MVQTKETLREAREQIAFRHILRAIRGIRYGTVTVIVQDGVVIQVDQTEKNRIDYSSADCKDGGGI